MLDVATITTLLAIMSDTGDLLGFQGVRLTPGNKAGGRQRHASGPAYHYAASASSSCRIASSMMDSPSTEMTKVGDHRLSRTSERDGLTGGFQLLEVWWLISGT